MARKHQYDQHFLRSPQLVAELLGHTSIKRRELVYDFGAGSGVITTALARRVRRVVAVEQEDEAYRALEQHMMVYDNVTVVRADLRRVPLPDEDFSVFSNPPFSLSSELLRRLIFVDRTPRIIALILQRQLAYKLMASDRHFTSALGIVLGVGYTARVRKPLRRTDFTPPPAVETVLFEAVRRETPLLPLSELVAFAAFVEACFADPRVFAPYRTGEKKPSELSPAAWVELYHRHSRAKKSS